MANTQAVCNSFKSEVMRAYHALGTTFTRGGTGADTFNAALYLSSATVNASTTVYSATGEATGPGYSAGGIAVTNANPPSTQSGVGTWTPSASLVYTTVTIGPVDAVLIYNSTQGDRAVEVCTFSAQTPVAATLTLTMPAGGAATSLLMLT